VSEETIERPEPQRLPAGNPYRNLQDIEERQRSIVQELGRIDAIDEPTVEDVNWQGTLIQEWNDNEAAAKPLRQRNADLRAIAQASRRTENREPATGRPAAVERGAPDLVVRNKQDPLDPEAMDRVRHNMIGPEELRNRAADLIEQDNKHHELVHDHADAAAYRAKNPQIAKHILMTGSEEYRNAFRQYMEEAHEKGDAAFRAINLTAGSGGYLLPYVLDPTIVLTNNASANPFRRVSRIVQTTSNAWQGVNSAGVTAAWVAEATTAADASPTVGQIQLIPVKGAAWVFGSYEALDDTNFGEQLPGLLADARDRLESGSFTTGSGTAVPLGVVPGGYVAGNGTLIGTTGAAAKGDIYAVQAALPPRFRNSASCGWMGSLTWLNQIRAIDTYGGSSFWANFGQDTPEQLLGKPIYEGSDFKSTTTAVTGSGGVVLTFADWSQFLICDRVGVSMLYEPMLKGTGANAQLPTGQAGWYMFFRTTSGVATTAAFKFLVNGSAA
jgi:HK97 family phage major capsid protein